MNWKSLLLLGVLGSFAGIASAQSPMVLGYYPYWAQYSQFYPKDLRLNMLTHIHYGYFVPGEAGALDLADGSDQGNFEELAKITAQASVKLMVSIGGPGNAEAMKAAGSSATSAKAAADAALALVTKHGLSGVEIDWQITDAADVANYTTLVEAFVQAFSGASPKPMLSATILGTDEVVGFIPTTVLANLDYLTLQATDQITTDQPAVGPNSDGPRTQALMAALAEKGIAKSKIVPVMPFYGKSFLGATGLGSAHQGTGSGNEGVVSWKDVMDKFNGTTYTVTFDQQSQSEVAVSATETIVFNGIPSFQSMAKHVKDNGYAGLGFFDLSMDHKEPIISLLVTIGKELRPQVDYKSKKK